MSRKLLDAGVVVLAAALLLIIALGGIDYDWGVVRIRLHSITRPLALLAVLLAVRAWMFSIDAAYVAARGLLALIVAAVAVYATYHVRVCGGLDSYGYVSTSELIASGHVIVPQPLVAYLPFEGASSAVAPLGYVAGPRGNTEVPRFPLGLPIVMAAFRLFGPIGPFYVPLLMSCVTLVVVFLIASGVAQRPPWPARHIGGTDHAALIGLFAAALVSIDPPLVYYAIQPMSDVPAACWLLAALWLRLGAPGRGWPSGDSGNSATAVAAGICAGMAFLTRPVLLGPALMIAVITLDRPARESIRYGVTLAAFIAVQMAINRALYGDVRLSGYGPASYMFEFSHARLAANVANFRQGLPYSHTPAIWLAWPAALVVLRNRKWAWQLSAVAVAAAVPYLFYIVFEGWETLRFILPTIVLVLILVAGATGELLARLQRFRTAHAAAMLMMLLAALALAAASDRFLRREGAYSFGDVEAKYALAGDWIARHTPERSVVFAGLHSGSIRYYGHRNTIRWDQIPGDKLSPTLRNLQAAGYTLYLALDLPTEPPTFDERFRQDPEVRIEQIGRVRVVNFFRFVSGG